MGSRSERAGEKKRPGATPHLTEEQIKAAFCRALSILLADRDRIIADGKAVISALTDCTALEKKAEIIDSALAGVAARIEQLVKSNRAVGTVLLCSNNHSHAASSK